MKQVNKKYVKKEVVWHFEDLKIIFFMLISFPFWIREPRYYSQINPKEKGK